MTWLLTTFFSNLLFVKNADISVYQPLQKLMPPRFSICLGHTSAFSRIAAFLFKQANLSWPIVLILKNLDLFCSGLYQFFCPQLCFEKMESVVASVCLLNKCSQLTVIFLDIIVYDVLLICPLHAHNGYLL